MNSSDHKWMSLAIQLAQKGSYTCKPNPKVGCVIVKNGAIIGQGFHQFAGDNHAEINALSSIPTNIDPEGSDVFISLEPCAHFGKTPPCVQALIKAKVKRVIIAILDPNPLVSGKGVSLLQQANIKTEVGLLSDKAYLLNLGFFKRIQKKYPKITIKSAISLDGKTAMQSGESQWITGEKARLDVHKMRAGTGAIITGIGTILQDDPQMNVRNIENFIPPVNVILDSNLEIPTNAKILQNKKVIIFSHTIDVCKKSILEKMGVIVIQAQTDKFGIKLTEVLAWLSDNEINEVLVEAGSSLSSSFIKQRLIDELIIYIAPKLLGINTKPLFNLSFNLMKQAIKLTIREVKQIGEDVRFTLIPK